MFKYPPKGFQFSQGTDPHASWNSYKGSGEAPFGWWAWDPSTMGAEYSYHAESGGKGNFPTPVGALGLSSGVDPVGGPAEGYFGGTTPLIASWLVSSSGNPLLPGYWVALAGAITLITALWFTPESCRLPLQRL